MQRERDGTAGFQEKDRLIEKEKNTEKLEGTVWQPVSVKGGRRNLEGRGEEF